VVVPCTVSVPRRDTLDEIGNFDNSDVGTRLVETLWLRSSIERCFVRLANETVPNSESKFSLLTLWPILHALPCQVCFPDGVCVFFSVNLHMSLEAHTNANLNATVARWADWDRQSSVLGQSYGLN